MGTAGGGARTASAWRRIAQKSLCAEVATGGCGCSSSSSATGQATSSASRCTQTSPHVLILKKLVL